MNQDATLPAEHQGRRSRALRILRGGRTATWYARTVQPRRAALALLALAPLVVGCMRPGRGLPPIESPTTEIPIEIRRGLVLVPVRIDGIDRELTFVLDTGAPTVLRREIADELGLIDASDAKLQDAAGAMLDSTTITIESLHVGALHMRRVAAFAADFPSFGEHCVTVDGFLGVGAVRGTGFLDRTAIEIDYANSTLALAPTAAELTPGGSTVRVQRHEIMPNGTSVVTTPVADVVIEGQRHWVLLDTGNTGTIDVSPGFFTDLGRSFDEPGLVTRTGALSQTATMIVTGTSYEARFDSLVLGDLKLRGVPITVPVAEPPLPEPAGARRVLLGYRLFRNFRFVLDVAGGIARFVPIPGADPSAAPLNLGFSWRDVDGKLVVATLVTTGPAARAGIVLGDEILAVGGTAIASGDMKGQCAVRDAIDAAEDREMTVRVRHEGVERDVVLKAEPVLPPVAQHASHSTREKVHPSDGPKQHGAPSSSTPLSP